MLGVKLKNIFLRASSHRFVRDNIFSLVVGFAIHAVNYLLILVSLRALSSTEFGRLNALLGCLLLISVAGNALQLRVAAKLASLTRTDANRYIISVERSVYFIALGAFAISIPFSRAFAQILNVTTVEVLAMLVVAATVLLSSVGQAVASAYNRVIFQSVSQGVATLLKFSFGVITLSLGWSVLGVLGAYATWGISLFVLARIARRGWHSPSPTAGTLEVLSPRDVLLIYLLLMSPFAFDQVLIQVFSSHASGEYAALSALSKFVFYAVSPIMWVGYSYLINLRHDVLLFRRYAVAGVIGTSLLALGVASVLSLAPGALLIRVISEQYRETLAYLTMATFTYALYAISYCITITLIAIGRKIVFAPLAAAVLAQVLLFVFYCDDLASAVWIQLTCNGLLTVFLVPFLFISLRQRSR